MELPKRVETFSRFLIAFLEFALNVGHFEKKKKKRASSLKCYWSSERVKESLKLLKSLEKHFYSSFSLVWVNFD